MRELEKEAVGKAPSAFRKYTPILLHLPLRKRYRINLKDQTILSHECYSSKIEITKLLFLYKQ